MIPGRLAVVSACKHGISACKHGLAAGVAAQLVHGFAQRLVAGGYLPGVPEARTWGNVLALAMAAADGAASAVKTGIATALDMLPALPADRVRRIRKWCH